MMKKSLRAITSCAKKTRKFSWRFWLNLATFALIGVIVFAARGEIVEAWNLLGTTNLAILSLLIPVQFLSYYASAEIFFTYLRARGQLKNTSRLAATGMSLELNFVNHVFPSGGVSGVSYMVWRLKRLGVPAGQSTMAQIMRYVVQMGTFMVMLVFALIWVTIEDRAAGWVIATTAAGIAFLIAIVFLGKFIVQSATRMDNFAHWLTRKLNRFVKFLTFGRKTEVIKVEKMARFFADIHMDYKNLAADKKLLLKPIIWSFAFNIFDAMLFFVAFWSLGVFVNPAILLIAYGAATLAGTVILTPGGSGVYEAIMIGILTASGIETDVALAGVILARVCLLTGTLLSGLVAYQYALHYYGRPNFTKEFDRRKNRDK